MFAGFDTSNYTTSAAVYDNGQIIQVKQMLSVKSGERGLRQSDAVFQHTVNMPKLLDKINFSNIEAVGVSARPRNIDKSYMPCFLVGEGIAAAVAKSNNVSLHKTSHQVGHILASLYSCNRIDLIYQNFIAFHLSGGTTEALLVRPDKENIIKADIIAESLDLKAGQAIDRTGIMLGLGFPCGKELDELSLKSNADFEIKPSVKGLNCSLSGIENKAQRLFENGEAKEDVAKFVLNCVSETVLKMLDEIIKKYGKMPVVFSGGVSANTILKNTIRNHFSAYFAKPEFSLDNAAGTAIYAYLKEKVFEK